MDFSLHDHPPPPRILDYCDHSRIGNEMGAGNVKIVPRALYCDHVRCCCRSGSGYRRAEDGLDVQIPDRYGNRKKLAPLRSSPVVSSQFCAKPAC
jgi:hypothetical protein